MKTYAYKQDKFDINKIEVVGNPTITEDGVASGFSESNYLTAPLIFGATSKWRIDCKFTIGSTVTSQRIWTLDSNNYNRLDIDNEGKIQLTFIDDGVKFNRGLVLKPNTTYYTTVVCTDINYYFTISETNFDDGTLYKHNIVKTNGVSNMSVIYLGSKDDVVDYFQGSIDLNAFKIYIDGNLIYSPTKPITFLEHRKEGFDKSKFEIVGSPTITEDGVYSSLQPPITNYIKVFDSLPIGKNIRVEYEGIVGQITDGKSAINTGVCIFREHTSTNNPKFGHFIACGTKLGVQNCIWYNPQLEIPRHQQGYYTSIEGDRYKVVFTFDDTKVNFELFVNGVSKITDYQNISDLEITSLDFYIGSPNFVSRQHSTTVDLKTVLIEIDDKEIFNGQNDKYYALIR